MGAFLSCCFVDVCCSVFKACHCLCCNISWTKAFAARTTYAIGFLLSSIFAFIFSQWGGKIVKYIPSAITDVCNEDCFSFMSVYKISLTLILYHSFLLIILLGALNNIDPRYHLHQSFWPLKFLLYLGGLVGCFFFPSPSLTGFWIAAIVAATLFILIQSVLLVGFAHDLTEFWIDLYEQTQNSFYQFSLIFFTILFNGITLVLNIFLFKNYAEGLVMFFLILNLILWVAMMVTSILPGVQMANPRSGIFQPTIISLFCMYLVATAVLEFGDQTSKSSMSAWVMAVGIVLTLVSVTFSAYTTASSSDKLLGPSEGGNDVESSKMSSDDSGQPEGESSYNYSYFHFIFVLAAFYMCLVLTKWQQPVFDPSFSLNNKILAVWIKIVTSWICSGLFIFSLIAPVLFPDRDFGRLK